jgi:hypothetical protein
MLAAASWGRGGSALPSGRLAFLASSFRRNAPSPCNFQFCAF